MIDLFMESSIDLDPIDLRVLDLLQQDASLSNQALADLRSGALTGAAVLAP